MIAPTEDSGLFSTIAGLPLHPLVVHLAVVVLPASALALVALVLVPRWRARYATLTQLVKAGVAAVRETSPRSLVMLHIALGGQTQLSNAWLDRMRAAQVDFDVIGQSYYPKWHGTLDELRANLTQLAQRYPQDLVVVEYSERKKEVNDIAFNLPGGKGRGTFIWEPLNTWEAVFNKQGQANALLPLYDKLGRAYKIP